jgi:hypothetical protein
MTRFTPKNKKVAQKYASRSGAEQTSTPSEATAVFPAGLSFRSCLGRKIN